MADEAVVTRELARLFLQIVHSHSLDDLDAVMSLGALEIIHMLSVELVHPRGAEASDATQVLHCNLKRDSDATIATMRQEISRLSLQVNELKRMELKLTERLHEAEGALGSGTATIRAKLEAELQLAAVPVENTKGNKAIAGLQVQIEHLSVENSELRRRASQLRGQLRSCEAKLRNLTLESEGAMRTAMLGEQEKLKQATRELEAAHREVQRARAQHDDAAGGARPPSLRSISQAKAKGQSFRNLLAARVASAAASEAKASSEATEEERAPSTPHHHDSAAAVSVPLIQARRRPSSSPHAWARKMIACARGDAVGRGAEQYRCAGDALPPPHRVGARAPARARDAARRDAAAKRAVLREDEFESATYYTKQNLGALAEGSRDSLDAILEL